MPAGDTPARVAIRRVSPSKVLWTAWRGPQDSRAHREALRSGRERPGVTLRVAPSEAHVRRVVAAIESEGSVDKVGDVVSTVTAQRMSHDNLHTSGFSAHAKIPERCFHGVITWADEIACEIAEVIGSRGLTDIASAMQEEHTKLTRRNCVEVLQESICCMSSPPITNLQTRLQQHDAVTVTKVRENLNEPTLEALLAFDSFVLPAQGAHVFTSTATANSGNDNAIVCALRILGLEDGVEFVHTSTRVKQTGKTGVSKVRTLHTPIEYDETCKRENWADMSFDLAQQFVRASGEKSFDVIYHWGCISQNKQKSPVSNHLVSSWKLHEEWNVMMTAAMMWHAVKKLKTGGALCLKVRIMDRAETIGLVAVLSLAFDSVEILPNSRQRCTFSIVVAKDATGDQRRRELILSVIRAGMSFEPVDTYTSDIVCSNLQSFKTIVSECQKVRRYMREEKAIRTTLFLQCLWLLSNYAHDPSKVSRATCADCVHSVLTQRYSEPLCKKLTQRFMHVIDTMSEHTKTCFVTCMRTRWMQANC